MHGGKCQDFGSGLNCTCSSDYTGIGCQYEFDACEAGLCQNGATCVDDGEGYSCICAPGFKGKNCDEDIMDCKENSCPPSATCIDLPGRFYCQCPFNLTGDDCRKCKKHYVYTYRRCLLCLLENLYLFDSKLFYSYHRGLRPLLQRPTAIKCRSSSTFRYWINRQSDYCNVGSIYTAR